MKAYRGSEVTTFLRCKQKWMLEWLLNLRAKKLDGKLFVGTLIHKWLEVWYKTNDLQLANRAMINLYQESDTQYMDQVELQEMWTLAQDIVSNYYYMWKDQDAAMKVIGTEVTFLVKMQDEQLYTGTIDLIWEDEQGKLWFMDHKTTTSVEKYEKNAVMDRQISRYWWALDMLSKGVGRVLREDGTWDQPTEYLGKEIGGFLYNIILKDTPKKPELLKKGGLSKNKAQKTTWKLYMEAIEENGLTTEGYGDILLHLASQEIENGNRFFKRVEVFRTENEVEAAIWEFYHTTNDMHDLEIAIKDGASYLAYRNITGDCGWDCQFKQLCQAQIQGDDWKLLLDLNYEKGE